MSFIEATELPRPRVSAELFMGAASPLWMYFTGAAASGLAYWWMSRWADPANIEAMFASARPTMAKIEVAAKDAVANVEAATEAAVTAALEAVEPVIEALPEPMLTPVGGESAPISAAAVEPEAVEALVTEPVEAAIEAAPALVETASEAVTEVVEAVTAPAPPAIAKVVAKPATPPRPRVKRTPPSAPRSFDA